MVFTITNLIFLLNVKNSYNIDSRQFNRLSSFKCIFRLQKNNGQGLIKKLERYNPQVCYGATHKV